MEANVIYETVLKVMPLLELMIMKPSAIQL